MPVSYNTVIDAVMLELGMLHDDSVAGRESILFNTIQAATKLNKQRLTKQLGAGDHRAASSSLITFPGVPLVTVSVDDSVLTEWSGKYFDLPTSIYSLDDDGGISFIRYMRNEIPANCPPAVANTPFTGTTLASLNAIYGSAYQRPRSDRPYYARTRVMVSDIMRERVYVFGVAEGVTHLLVGLYAIPNYLTVDPDSPIDLPDEYIDTLKKMLLDDYAWLMQIPMQRRKNDGRDFEPNQTVPSRPHLGMNDPRKADA